ncbi:MAG TPA: FAD-dependent monooxygenase [Steroidobacteraceae bacterium]|jgi:2-polyprenyl-6-methoxyphenol hydroxylase-like FAD-dependent oxidoreductase|nr:FAD-dependent monooxygenase [Steroidobacteraceae bacterium]
MSVAAKVPETDEVPVLIAGGGMVGLSAATFLAHQGISSLAIERLKASSPLPRAAFFHMRTLEMFRSVGIEGRVREASEKDFVPEGAIIAMDAVSGRKLADIIPNLNEGVDAVSPCRRLFLNQPSLEPILRERALQAGATVLQGTEIVGVQQDASGVTVRVKSVDGGEERELRGRYLIAADGAHSKVRDALGIRYEGRGAFSNSLTIYFTADLSPWIGDNAWSIIYVNNPVLGGFFRMNRSAQAGFLAVNTIGDPKQDPQAASNAAADVSEARLIELVRAGVGVPDLPVKIDGYTRWRAVADVAQRFQEGRIFIAGDAAHLMPPNGGFGGNTGIHDAHNLAWKLAAVLKGCAHPRLLDTYESERKPVARFTVEQAFARYVTRTAPWLQSSQRTEPLAHDFDIELGYLYGSPERTHADPRTTSGMPGSRAPHLWLTRNGTRLSTIDLTGQYLLLVGPEGEPWMRAAASAAASCGPLALDAWCIGKDFDDGGARFPKLYGISPRGACLVRPDGFVAWRSEDAVPDPAATLREALARSLMH